VRVFHGRLALLVVLAAASLVPAPARGAAAVTGIVRTALRPLGGVHVAVPSVGAWATSDTTGRFLLRDVPAGVHALELVAVGYTPVHGTIVVGLRADSAGQVVDAGPFLLAPLRPDETPIGFKAPDGTPAPRATATLPVPEPEPGLAEPGPAPVAPTVGFFRTDDEEERWPTRTELRAASDMPHSTGEAFADLLRRVAVADSITAATGGTGAPGFETWRQWGDRLALFAGDSARALEPRLGRDSALVWRAVAYARARAALAAGRTVAGYRMAAEGRAAVARARGASRGDDTAFLRFLGSELDRVFTPGSAPPKPPRAAPVKKKRPVRRRR
jgi:hypothetical protein